ncbi:MAG: hypothetical protein KDD94_06810 [Calditrichaeota bacterium]|nr:hypothetical protein [Calditrichota bacterium]
MQKKLGIWIDTKHAILVYLFGDDTQVKIFDSDIVTRERIDGEKKSASRFGKQFLNDEKHKEERHAHQVKEFLQLIVSEISDCDTIVVFGPSGMKIQLEKELKAQHELMNKPIAVETTDKMTENQTVAWVKQYFAGHS